MKVISGFLKGRNIKGYNIDGTRPTMDRVKESLFSMIQQEIEDSICLDLFAGSGSLGIESISNGSKMCYFCDKNKEVIDCLKKTITEFKINDKCKLMLNDYRKCLLYLKNNNIKFDIIFLDPPYKMEVIEEIINLIIEYNILNDNGIIVCEYELDKLNDNYDNLTLIKTKKYGKKYINIYEK